MVSCLGAVSCQGTEPFGSLPEVFGGGIVFALVQPGAGPTGSNICTIDPASATPATHLLISNGAQPRVTGDGQRIMFSRIDSVSLDVYVSKIQGGNQINITSTDWNFSEEAGDWSPDGLQLCYIARNRATLKQMIRIARRDGLGSWDLTDTSIVECADLPRWSPDGSKIAFLGQDHPGGSYWLGTVSSNGTGLIRLDEATFAGPQWSPSGTMIAYSKPVGDQFLLHVYDVKSGVSTLVGPNCVMGNGSLACWLPDERLVCTASGNTGISIVLVVLSPTTSVTEIGTGFRHPWTVIASPKGMQIGVIEQESGTGLSLFTVDVSGLGTRRVATLSSFSDASVDECGFVAWVE